MKLEIKFTSWTWSIYSGGRHIQVLYQMFVNATNSKDRQTIDGESSAKCRANFLGLLAEHWTQMCQCLRCDFFCRSTTGGLQIHLLTGPSISSVLRQTFTALPLPPMISLESAKI